MYVPVFLIYIIHHETTDSKSMRLHMSPLYTLKKKVQIHTVQSNEVSNVDVSQNQITRCGEFM